MGRRRRRRGRPAGAAADPERPTTPTNTAWIRVPANTIVDAPVASTPVNEAPPPTSPPSPPPRPPPRPPPPSPPSPRPRAEARGRGRRLHLLNVLGQWAEEAAAVNTENGAAAEPAAAPFLAEAESPALWEQFGTY